jgi:hypothetical protein
MILTIALYQNVMTFFLSAIVCSCQAVAGFEPLISGSIVECSGAELPLLAQDTFLSLSAES